MNKQKYFTPLGFTTPEGKCKISSFASGCHRVALFPISYHTDEIEGYRVRKRCVNCGKWIGRPSFMISKSRNDLDEMIYKGY